MENTKQNQLNITFHDSNDSQELANYFIKIIADELVNHTMEKNSVSEGITTGQKYEESGSLL
jgi:hypothetical protein